MTDTAAVIHPKFHHVNLKTTRLQEMIDFYGTLVGAEVVFQFDGGAWLSNDAANHRIALLAFPNFVDDPEKDTPHRHASLRVRVHDLRGVELQLPPAQGGGASPRRCAWTTG